MSLWFIDFFSSTPSRIWESLTELRPILKSWKCLSKLCFETIKEMCQYARIGQKLFFWKTSHSNQVFISLAPAFLRSAPHEDYFISFLRKKAWDENLVDCCLDPSYCWYLVTVMLSFAWILASSLFWPLDLEQWDVHVLSRLFVICKSELKYSLVYATTLNSPLPFC